MITSIVIVLTIIYAMIFDDDCIIDYNNDYNDQWPRSCQIIIMVIRITVPTMIKIPSLMMMMIV